MNLADLLETFGFKQHVWDSTNQRDNSLDLIITSEISHIIVTEVKPTTMITAQYTIEYKLHQPKPTRLKRDVENRKYAAIDKQRFAVDIAPPDFHVHDLDPSAIKSNIISQHYILQKQKKVKYCNVVVTCLPSSYDPKT